MNQNGVWIAIALSLGLAQTAWSNERNDPSQMTSIALGDVPRELGYRDDPVETAQVRRNFGATSDFLRSQRTLPRNDGRRYIPARPAYPIQSPSPSRPDQTAHGADSQGSGLGPTVVILAMSIITLASALRLTRQRL